jgi:diguanylate cyclase (GGDEF)-like protein/PAS domain S-box-containing protein
MKTKQQASKHLKHLQFAVETALDAFFLCDKQGNILYVNESACKSLGYSYEELTSMSVADIDPDIIYFASESFNIKGTVYGGGQGVFESRHRRKDGTEFPVEVIFRDAPFEGKDFSFVFARDITVRKKARLRIDILQFAIDNAVDAIYMSDQDARIFYANKRACETTGYSSDELMAMTVYDLDPACTPEIFQSIWDDAHAGALETIERHHRKKDGSLYPVEISVNNSVYDGFPYSCTFARDITGRKEIEREMLFHQFAIDNAGDAVIIINSKGNIVYANAAACSLHGYSRDELLAMSLRDINPDAQVEMDGELLRNLIAAGTFIGVSHHHRKDGSSFPVEVHANILSFEDEYYSCSIVRDISAQLEAENALRESEEKFRLISDTSPVALIIHRVSDGLILYANHMAQNLFSRKLDKIINHPVNSLFDDNDTRAEFMRVVAGNSQVNGHELQLGIYHNRPLWVSLNARTISMHGEQVICSAMLDITQAHELSSQLSYHATYDSLTGLVNRREFETRLQRIISTSRQQNSEHVLCFLDLDQFKVINDSCGHIAGDELLRQLGQMLQDRVRKHDTLARLGGDEFGVLLEDCGLEQGQRVANSIRKAVQGFRFVWEGNAYSIGVSIGLVPITQDDETFTDVMKRADAACYEAKEGGRNRVHVYNPGADEKVKHRNEMQWMARITSALEQNRLQLWRQTIAPVCATGFQGNFYEVLLRMKDTAGGILEPEAFLPYAERYNLASRLDRWVVFNTLDWFRHHPDAYEELWLCSMNLSVQSLMDENFLDEISAYFSKNALKPEKFCFEVSETAAISNLNHATRFITALTELGCHFALDDFGSGLASFAYLGNLPVDYIKIDGIFVEDILENKVHAALVKSINEVCHVMGKKTIAKFAGSQPQLEKLKQMGVDYAQGFGIGKPKLLIDGSGSG